MKRIVLLLIASVFAGVVVQAKDLEDFKDGKTWGVYRKGFKLAMEQKSADRGQSAKISWDEDHFKFLEFHNKFKKNDILFESALNGTISFEVYTDTPEAIAFVGIRLIDSKGEVFQLRKPFKVQGGKWTKLSYAISSDTKFGHWGGNKDGKVDFPVHFLGLAMDFNQKSAGSGSIYVDNIKLTKGSQP